MIAKLVALVLSAAIVIIGTSPSVEARKKGPSPEAQCRANCREVYANRIADCVANPDISVDELDGCYKAATRDYDRCLNRCTGPLLD